MRGGEYFVELIPNVVLTGPFWSEPIRVLAIQRLSEGWVKIETVGLHSQRYAAQILGPAELAQVQIGEGAARDFAGDATAAFFAIEAARIRFAYQFDPHFAVNVSQVDPLPHQIEAVYHYILRNPRLRFLLADDPGAGKTIMAGLLLKEIKYRGLVTRTLIVVPGHLKEQWQRELKEKFGEHFPIVDRGVVNAYWGRNVWAELPQAITSMDFLKREDVLPGLAEVHWDLVIVDEAHKMAAYRYGDRTKKTERYQLGELLSRHTSYLLFLTATPHRGDPENFRLFLDLLEPGMFADTDLLAESIESRDNPLFLRRLKEDLTDFDQRPLFPPRRVHTVKYRLTDDEKRLYNEVTRYVQQHFNRALQKEKRNVAFALTILQRRLASSTRGIRRSLERRKKRLENLLKQGRIIQEQGMWDEEELEDLAERERWEQEDLLEKLTDAETLEELEREISRVGELIGLAREVEKGGEETKLARLREVTEDENLRGTGVKLLIFTEARDTLEYLVENLRRWGFSVTTIHGGMNLDRRIAAEHDFRHQAQIMVSTEAGGEGINLQFCWLMVNYDIPWNPNRLEQRMGRIHRYGQQKEVHIYNLVAADTIEGRILFRLFDKLDRMRDELGSDRVFDVIGDVLPGKSLRDLIIEAIANPRSLDDILSELEAIPDEEAIRRVREAALEGLATRHVELSRVLNESREAKENRLVPEYIEAFFLQVAERVGMKAERRQDGFLRVPAVPFELRQVPQAFKNRFGEVFREYRKIAFRKGRAFKDPEAEFVAPGHPLLEALIEKARRDFAPEAQRGAIFFDPAGRLDGLLWFFEGEVRDGAGQIAGRRLFALYQGQDGAVREVSPAILWDLKPAQVETSEVFETARLSSAKSSEVSDEDAILGLAAARLETYLEEIRARRQRDAAIKQKYGGRSLERLIGESDAKLLKLETRRAKGEMIPEPTLQNERRRKGELLEKKRNLERAIEAETHLLLSIPKVVGVFALLPAPVADELAESEEIERIGMEVAMAYERRAGRLPEDVSAEKVGYDIRSLTPGPSPARGRGVAEGRGEDVRYIEVKARAGVGKIALTRNEWFTAQRLAEEYWLYVVVNAAAEPRLYLIWNPAMHLQPEEEVQVVRYVVAQEQWQGVAEEAGG